MRIVLDTNILVRANVRAQGPAREVLAHIVHGDHVLIISPFLLREVARSLAYPRLQRLWKLTPQDIQEHIDFLAKSSYVVDPVAGPPVVPADPNDDPVIHAALAGKADVLCTLDSHFFHVDVLAFCRKQGVSVLTDVELLVRLAES
jgi:uncharacterized protein